MIRNISGRIVGVLVLVCLIAAVHAAPATESQGVEFRILHNNDMHSRFDQTGPHSNACQQEDIVANKCYGGFARISSVLKRFRTEAQNGGPPVLYLNAGDTYTGTPWFTLFKDRIVADFLNILKPDAMCLGNHEFDYGVNGIIPLLNSVNFPVVISNLNISSDHPLWHTKALKKSATFDVQGYKVGVIGYLTPETKSLTPPSDIEYIPEIEAINAEAAALKNRGVNILIALGHSGFDMDKQIAKNCPEIDVVVGGHTNTFLYTGQQPDAEKIEGLYPTVITQKSGKKVPCVQAYAYTKYLGHLKLNFDNKGNLREFSGEPILLNSAVQRDPEVSELLERYRPRVTAVKNDIVGVTKVFLNGTSCRAVECNLGNLVTDAMIHVNAFQHTGKYWTDAGIAFMQGGGIRSSASLGEISRYDLITMFPFNNTLVKVNVTGETIRLALERSVERYNQGQGEFLQMSGVHVHYDLARDPGHRVKSVKVVCSDCPVPTYYDLEAKKVYTIILTSFTYDGGDGFTMFKTGNGKELSFTDYDAIARYIHDFHTIYPAVEWRITLEGQLKDKPGSASMMNISVGLIVITALLNIFQNY